MKHFIKQFLRMLYGVVNGDGFCIICGRDCLTSKICKHCTSDLFNADKLLSVQRCEICGKELLSFERICSECRQGGVKRKTDKVIALFSYRLWNKELMFIWKIKGIRSLSFVFAKLLSEVLTRIGADFIVPVPPRPGKIQSIGWDQIDELCNYLKYWFGFKVIKVLERVSTVQQKRLDKKSRVDNIGKNYCLKNRKELKSILKPFGGTFPKRVTVVDDVMTTGSTLESCSLVLKQGGVEFVQGVTLFIVD
ncbi:MAG: ComF family protein [Treponema sp.]|nr:ComF family protein [Treponema sp.]